MSIKIVDYYMRVVDTSQKFWEKKYNDILHYGTEINDGVNKYIVIDNVKFFDNVMMELADDEYMCNMLSNRLISCKNFPTILKIYEHFNKLTKNINQSSPTIINELCAYVEVFNRNTYVQNICARMYQMIALDDQMSSLQDHMACLNSHDNFMFSINTNILLAVFNMALKDNDMEVVDKMLNIHENITDILINLSYIYYDGTYFKKIFNDVTDYTYYNKINSIIKKMDNSVTNLLSYYTNIYDDNLNIFKTFIKNIFTFVIECEANNGFFDFSNLMFILEYSQLTNENDRQILSRILDIMMNVSDENCIKTFMINNLSNIINENTFHDMMITRILYLIDKHDILKPNILIELINNAYMKMYEDDANIFVDMVFGWYDIYELNASYLIYLLRMNTNKINDCAVERVMKCIDFSTISNNDIVYVIQNCTVKKHEYIMHEALAHINIYELDEEHIYIVLVQSLNMDINYIHELLTQYCHLIPLILRIAIYKGNNDVIKLIKSNDMPKDIIFDKDICSNGLICNSHASTFYFDNQYNPNNSTLMHELFSSLFNHRHNITNLTNYEHIDALFHGCYRKNISNDTLNNINETIPKYYINYKNIFGETPVCYAFRFQSLESIDIKNSFGISNIRGRLEKIIWMFTNYDNIDFNFRDVFNKSYVDFLNNYMNNIAHEHDKTIFAVQFKKIKNIIINYKTISYIDLDKFMINWHAMNIDVDENDNMNEDINMNSEDIKNDIDREIDVVVSDMKQVSVS